MRTKTFIKKILEKKGKTSKVNESQVTEILKLTQWYIKTYSGVDIYSIIHKIGRGSEVNYESGDFYISNRSSEKRRGCPELLSESDECD